MKRRRFVQAALALPAGTSLLAQQPVPPTGGPGLAASSSMDYPKIEALTAEQAALPVLRFFSAPQMAALRRLSDLLMPRTGSAPGAIDAQVPEFLDFWIGKSPSDRQKIYTAGLDALNKQASAKYRKSFADLDDASAAAVIESAIKQPWSYVAPTDPLAHFLREVRHDIRSATMNSREFAGGGGGDGGRAGGGRRQSGMGQYWYPLD